MKEYWREIPGEAYAASNHGRIRRSVGGQGARAGLILRPGLDSHGYLQVCLQGRMHLVHKLVWRAFRGEIPKGLEVNHKDSNRQNNWLRNLEVGSRKWNMTHAAANGRMRKTLTEEIVRYARANYRPRSPMYSLPPMARKFGVSAPALGDAIRRKTWAWLT